MNKRMSRGLAATLAGFTLLFAGCVSDVYDPKVDPNPNPGGGSSISPELKDFGFATRSDVKISINYNAPGFKAIFELYSENPIDAKTNLRKKEIKPLFTAFTDKDSKFEGTYTIPTAVKELWVYTNRLGISGCYKMDFANGTATYNASKTSKATTRATGSELSTWFSANAVPFNVTKMLFSGMGEPSYDGFYKPGTNNEVSNMYSIVKWGEGGEISNSNAGNVRVVNALGNGETLAKITGRVGNFLEKYPAGQGAGTRGELLIKQPSDINIITKEAGTELQVTFLDEFAGYENSFGYYYYPKSKEAYYNNNADYIDMQEMQKYIVFPNASNHIIDRGTTVSLKYFDSKNPQGTTQFPKDYIVGWFLVSKGFKTSDSNNGRSKDKNTIAAGRVSGQNDREWGIVHTSNARIMGGIDFRRFISVYDKTSGNVIIGVEDILPQEATTDSYDYKDLMFAVSSNKELGGSEKAEIPVETPVDPVPPTDKPGSDIGLSNYQFGTLAFEDLWPSSGDYDMNDVAIEFSRNIISNTDNNVSQIVETFKFVQDIKAASFLSQFAYEVANLGNISGGSELCTAETETNSIILTENSRIQAAKPEREVMTITRTFSSPISMNDALYFNPYIIVQTDRAKNGRLEVHLPNRKMTAKGDQSLIGQDNDALYMDKSGKYPFAIEIPIQSFNLSPERTPISETYPRFKQWVESLGKTDTDWYN